MLLSDLNPIERFDQVPAFVGRRTHLAAELWLPLAPLASLPTTAHVGDWAERELQDQMRLILLALHAVDAVFEREFDYHRHVYIVGEEQLVGLVGPNALKHFDVSTTAQLEILSVIGLIYRFNVARKFGYSDRGVLQFRLNGWGRALVEDRNLVQGERFSALFARLANTILAFESEYQEILTLCNAESRPLDTKRIHTLNQILPIKIAT